jgi:hypothetical protein
MEKEQLVQIVKSWVKIDNEMRELQKQQNLRKIEKKRITSRIMEIMKQNEIYGIDIKDGQIIYKQKSSKQAITKKVLLSLLGTFFEGDIIKAEEINTYIMANREERVTECIVRKPNATIAIETKPSE